MEGMIFLMELHIRDSLIKITNSKEMAFYIIPVVRLFIVALGREICFMALAYYIMSSSNQQMTLITNNLSPTNII